MSLIWQALWFIVAVSVLVTVHEFGHYWVARRLGFKVLRFSVGFGRPLLSRVAGPDRTEYVLAAIPLGGYVKMLDEREGPVDPAELARSFTRKPPWQRIAVLLAGPGFNIAFAILILWLKFWANGVDELKPVVGDVMVGTYAAQAGLHSGDRILSINGEPVSGQRDVVFGLLDAVSAGNSAVLKVRGKEDDLTRTATLSIPNAADRKRLTEPSALFQGLGFQFWEPSVPAVVREVIAGGPAAKAGLQVGDQIVSIDDKPVDYAGFVPRVEDQVGHTLLVRYRRGTSENATRVQVIADRVEGRTVGRIKILVGPPVGAKYPDSMIVHTDYSPGVALGRAAQEAWSMTVLQGRLFGHMVMGQVSLKNLSGPLSIAQFAGESADAGVAPFLEFLVLISLSLGFLNLLPIPILDGGQIVFQLVEWLKGSPLSERAQAFSQQLGIALLILLMGVALFNDIARQFG